MELQSKTKSWHHQLIEDCKAIITESEFTARWALVEGYHELGKRIMAEVNNGNFARVDVYGQEIVTGLSESLQVHPKKIYRAMAFYKKFPDLNKLPEGKNTSWNQIVTRYLPVNGESKAIEAAPHCSHCPLHCGQ